MLPLLVSLLTALPPALPPAFPVDEIQPGQKGECLTVFAGEVIEPFPFEVRGVMLDFLGPGKHVVVIRLLGEKAEFTGVVAGMSGSPCAIGGRLVGALAYSFAAFAKEPIAGVTPVTDMTEVFDVPDAPLPWRLPNEGAAPSRVSRVSGAPLCELPWAGVAQRTGVAQALAHLQDWLPPQPKTCLNEAGDWETLLTGRAPSVSEKPQWQPIQAALSVSGMSGSMLRHFAPWFRTLGFEPSASGNSGRRFASSTLAAGSAVAAVLVHGDVSLAATGTVTVVDGNRVLAFGHPFFGGGAISIPMAQAFIVNTMASDQRSYKMSTAGPVVGEITQDRLTAIGGVLGRIPKTIDIAGSLRVADSPSTFALHVARDLFLSPRLVAVSTAGALSGRVPVGNRSTVHATSTIHIEGLAPVVVDRHYASQGDGDMLVQAAVDMSRVFAALWDTSFAPPPAMRIEMAAQIDPIPREELIEGLFVSHSIARPRDTVEVAVRLRPVLGDVRFERFSLSVPDAWASDEVVLVAASAELADMLQMHLAAYPVATSLSQIAEWFRGRRVNDRLYVLAFRHGSGLTMDVLPMDFLPPSIVSRFGSEPWVQEHTVGLAWEESRPVRSVLHGGADARLVVGKP